jgi:hypothetical protein
VSEETKDSQVEEFMQNQLVHLIKSGNENPNIREHRKSVCEGYAGIKLPPIELGDIESLVSAAWTIRREREALVRQKEALKNSEAVPEPKPAEAAPEPKPAEAAPEPKPAEAVSEPKPAEAVSEPKPGEAASKSSPKPGGSNS